MKNTISIETEGLKIKGTSERMVQLLIAGMLTQTLPPAANVQPVTSAAGVPEVGAYWPGQGGINGGFVMARGDVPAHYLIIAKDDVGKHEWGNRDKQSGATSKTDGHANSMILLADGGHPAAEAADQYTADGHNDFFLPAAAELYQGWLNCPEAFSKETWYWSSSQRSADSAFTMGFDDGYQDYLDKGSELRVRPVRRFFI
ncbi:DUF1566 domain-containing protein [Pseudomonas sp. SDO55104_S430]